MGNLGGYQKAVELMKAAGGPGKAVAIGMSVVAAAGYGVFRLAEYGGKKGISAFKVARARSKSQSDIAGKTFTVTESGVDDQGLVYKVGDGFTVLTCDADAVLIVLDGNTKNPYVVSAEFLSTISDVPTGQTQSN